MDLKTLTILAIQVSIMSTVVGFGLDTRWTELRDLLRRPGLLARSLLAVFVVMPIVAIVLARWFNFPKTVEIALIALAISPVPPLLPRKQAKAAGEASFALGLMAILALLSIVTIPIWVTILDRVFGRPLSTPAAVVPTALKTVVLPFAAGMVVRALAPAVAGRLQKPLKIVGNVLLPAGVLVLLIGVFPAIWALFGGGTVLAMVVFVLVGIVVGHFLGGPDPDDSVVLALATSCRHPAIAFAIASENYPEGNFGATVLLYAIVSALVGVPYLRWMKSIAGPPAMAGPRPRFG